MNDRNTERYAHAIGTVSGRAAETMREAVRDEHPAALALCVEALAALLEQEPAKVARRRGS